MRRGNEWPLSSAHHHTINANVGPFCFLFKFLEILGLLFLKHTKIIIDNIPLMKIEQEQIRKEHLPTCY